ncbi:GntR family transcriptional regulator [Xanthobacter sediminis]
MKDMDLARAGTRFVAADAAYQEIKWRIMNRGYAPGEKLSEARLSAELGVGRSPIRTALARLQGEGWIAVSPQSGTYVKGLTTAEINEVFELRLILEPAAAALAAERMETAELDRLKRAFETLGPMLCEDRVDDYLALDLQTHRTIYNAGGNQLIAGILLNLLDKVHWIQRGCISTPRQVRAYQEIRELLGALERRDSEEAARVMRTHIFHTAQFRSLPAAKTAFEELAAEPVPPSPLASRPSGRRRLGHPA